MDKLNSLLLIREGERPRVFYFCLLFLLIGAGMAIGRSTADALFFKRYGIENLPAMYGLLSVVFVAVSVAYAAVADRFAPERVFTSIFIALLVTVSASWILIAYIQWETAYPIYFIIYEIASELLLLHGALYIGQNFETLESKRLSPLMFGSAQLGTIFGGLFVAGATFAVGIANILLMWCMVLLASIFLVGRYHARKGKSPFYQRRNLSRNGIAASIQEIKQGLYFTRKSALLRAASFSLFFMVLAFYIMCFSLNKIYTGTFTTEAALGRFFGLLTAATSSIALLVQFFLTGRLLRWFGIKKMNIVFPVGGLITYFSLLMVFSFPAALVGSFVREVMLPAIRRPTRNLFFNALPDYIQGRARAVAVSLVLPLALATASGVLVLFKNDINTFLIIGLLANLVYVYFALRMNKAYVSELVGKLRDRLFLPDRGLEALLRNSSGELLRELERGVDHNDDALAFGYAKLLLSCDADRFKSAVLFRIGSAAPEYQDRMIKLLAGNDIETAAAYCREHLEEVADLHLKATMFKILIEARCDIVVPKLEGLLNDANPRMVAMGVLGVYEFGVLEHIQLARQRWQGLLMDQGRGDSVMPGMALLGSIPEREYYPVLLDALQSDKPDRQTLALRVLKDWPHEHLTEPLAAALSIAMGSFEPAVRTLTVNCYCLLPADQRDELYLRALEDPHMDVRTAAIEAMDDNTKEFELMLCAWVIGNAGSPRAQRAVLTYLNQCQVPESVLWEIINAKTEDALEVDKVIHGLENIMKDEQENKSLRLLKVTLEGRKKQIANLALQVLERVAPPEEIRMIHAGINSKDRRNRANAVEALSHLKNKSIGKKLSFLFEEDPSKLSANDLIKSNTDFEPLFEWCLGRPDPWLRECVQYAKTRLTPQVPAHG